MYQALYRKWRPKTFDDVVGQEVISETLKRQVVSGRLSHAYLFVGTRGTGKTSCAKILAKAVNCLSPQGGNPCNACAHCVGIDSGSILDVLELDAASNNGVDNVRALREEAVFTPVAAKKRVYIIDEVHMLSTAAFNALLKILEEPPEHLIFILATTEIHKVPATIMSRCQRFSFKRLLPETIAGHLITVAAQENMPLTDDAAHLLARLADGALRDGLSLLDQCASDETIDTERVLSAIGLAGSEETARLLSAVADGDVGSALTQLDSLYHDGKVMSSLLGEMADLLRDILLSGLTTADNTSLFSGLYDVPVLQDFAKRMPTERLLSMLEILRQTQLGMSKSAGGRGAAELCLIRLCDSRLCDDPATLLARLSALEKKLEGTLVPAPAQTPMQPVLAKPVPVQMPSAEPDGQRAAPPMGNGAPVELTIQNKASVADDPAGPLTGDSENVWPAILALIKKEIDIPPFTFLSDPSHVLCDISADAVTIRVKNGFALSMLNVPPITTAIRDAALTTLRRPAAVRVILDEGTQGGTSDKLDTLKRYPNITFE
ncbi:DNA polymerase III subunit gamma/tau [Oscillospiraceae bacterium CM]|nr:DNA polymerase III subunit gamma/tau [Oscillospiraceae bacterium CM]